MSFKKIPYHLKHSIDEILRDARNHITVSYQEVRKVHSNKSIQKPTIACRIIDQHRYSVYFYEPLKFEMPEIRIISCENQRSAHQNAIIALKQWEDELREFLIKPLRKNTESKTV